jgi:8-oxo-dGTP diphosphatase
MALYLIRHAKAGDRSSWTGDDRVRPLTSAGRRQAERLVERFVDLPVGRVLSSPYVRCVETVEPLALSRGITVEREPRLAEAGSFFDVIELLESLPDSSVLCSHGDLIPETIDALVRRGMEVGSAPDWRKGSMWVLERVGDEIVSGAAVAPPDSK